MREYPYYVIGIDCGMTRTGLALLTVTGPGHYRLVDSTGYRPPDSAKPPAARIGLLARIVFTVIGEWGTKYNIHRIIVEDPTDGRLTKRHHSQVSDAMLGAAFGATLAALSWLARGFENDALVITVPAALWIPKRPGAGTVIAAKHEYNVALVRDRVKGIPANVSDDEIMAAGVAAWWCEDQRMPEALRAKPLPKRTYRKKVPL